MEVQFDLIILKLDYLEWGRGFDILSWMQSLFP